MGVIHGAAVLDDEEVGKARELGLKIMPGDRPMFALPCPRLEGTICGIYGNRPKVCCRYKCQLLQNVEAGASTLNEGKTVVAEAKRLLVEVRKTTSQQDPLFRLRKIALELFLDKSFRNSRDRKSIESTTLNSQQEADHESQISPFR